MAMTVHHTQHAEQTSQLPKWFKKPYSSKIDTPVPVRLTILRKAAWAGLLVPTCCCKAREFRENKGWLTCTTCGAPVRPLDGVEQEAETLDEALSIALGKIET